MFLAVEFQYSVSSEKVIIQHYIEIKEKWYVKRYV